MVKATQWNETLIVLNCEFTQSYRIFSCCNSKIFFCLQRLYFKQEQNINNFSNYTGSCREIKRNNNKHKVGNITKKNCFNLNSFNVTFLQLLNFVSGTLFIRILIQTSRNLKVFWCMLMAFVRGKIHKLFYSKNLLKAFAYCLI